MSGGPFRLRPFPGSPIPEGLTLGGAMVRQGGRLHLGYALAGPLTVVLLPPPAAAPARRWLLWEATCFELFLAVPGAEGYWEFNLSPAGDWNAFRLSGYRRGIEEEPAFTGLALDVRRRPRELTLEVGLELGNIVPADQTLEVGLAAVIKLANGTLTYWALAHPGREPDFHRRDSFLVPL